MKKILLFVILTMCAGIGIAQPSLSSRISTLGTLNRTYYLYDTGFRRQNVMKHFRINDSLIHYDSIIAATVVSGHDLDNTLTLGNESDLLVNIRNSGLEFKTYHTYNGLTTLHDPASSITDYPVTFIGREGSYNVLYLRDAFGYFGYMGAGTLTADRKVLLPDEGDGVGLDATLVTHTTEDALTVTDGTNVATYDKNVALIDDGVGNQSAVLPSYVVSEITAGTTVNNIKHQPTSFEYNYTNSVGSISKITTLHFERPSFTSGTQDVWFPSATNDTLAVKGDITAMGNFATVDLTLTGTRAHHMDRYGVSFDSTLMWKIADTNNIYLFNLNDPASYATSMAYIGNVDKILRLSPNVGTGFQSRLYLSNSVAGNNSVELFGGNNKITMTQSSGVCFVSIAAGGSNPATVIIDSTTRAVGVNHLTGTYLISSVAAGTGAGTGPTITMGSGSTDLNGYINITTGTTCAADATVATVTFGLPYRTAPKTVILSPANKEARNLTNGQQVFVNQADITTTTFVLKSNSVVLVDATAYQWYYTVIQ